MRDEFKTSSERSDATFRLLTTDIHELQEVQQKDNIFRERGERFDATDAAQLELRIQSQFRREIVTVSDKFMTKLDAANVENIRRLERLEGKIDTVNEKLH